MKRTAALITLFTFTTALAACDSDSDTGGAGAGGMAGTTSSTSSTSSGGPVVDNKALVTEALHALFVDKDPAAVDKYVTTEYLQHNPYSPSGSDNLKAWVSSLAGNADFKFEMFRALGDGDLVAAHNRFTGLSGKGTSNVTMDIFRVEGGKIAEHWDCMTNEALDANGQPVPNASGHTMVDGPTVIQDLDRTAVNKAAAQAFVDTVLVQGQLDKVGGFFVGDGSKYVQHNPLVGDGLAALGAFLAQAGPLAYTKVGKVVGEGDLVMTQSEGFLGADPNQSHLVFYDIFRMTKDASDGDKPKVAEHWDCIWPYVEASMTKSGLPML